MKIIQLTDLHLVPEGQKIHEINPSKRFERALANIKLRHPDLDLLVITGDLCNEGDTPSYCLLRALLEKHKLNYQLVLGNHDQREPFKGVFRHSDRSPWFHSIQNAIRWGSLSLFGHFTGRSSSRSLL